MRVSVVIPTIGRPALMLTLTSLGLRPGDQAIVVADGPGTMVHSIVDKVDPEGAEFVVLETPKRERGWGAGPRTLGLTEARGDVIAFVDDDDWWAPGARDLVETASRRSLNLFKIRYPNGHELWRDPEVRCGNVSTQMIVVPNLPRQFGRWTTRREGDFDFISGCQFPRIFREEVLALMGHNDGEI